MALARERARVGNLILHHPDDHEAIAAARRDITAARLAAEHDRLRAQAAELAASAPPLTAEQVSRLRALLPAPAEGFDDEGR